jgi:uncharacterized protein YcgI (DUF1989 family)
LKVPGGSKITIIDLHGQQASDFVALSASDLTEVLSGVETRRALLSLYIKARDLLISSRGRPMLRIIEDTVGVHDYTVPACDPSRYEVDFGVRGVCLSPSQLLFSDEQLWSKPKSSAIFVRVHNHVESH